MVNGPQYPNLCKTKPYAMPFKFESLRVWQLSLELTDEVDMLTKNFRNMKSIR